MFALSELAMCITCGGHFLFWFRIQLAMKPRRHFHESRTLMRELDHSFQPRIAYFHPFFHAGRQHRPARFRVRQRHPDGHQRP